MKRKQTVTPSRLAEYEAAEVTKVKFHLVGDSLKAIELSTSLGPLDITLDSYSLYAYEPAMRDVFRVTVTDSREQIPDFSKDFDTEQQRDSYVRRFDHEGGRFALALSDFKEPAV